MITVTGFRQPEFSGISSATSVRSTYSTAAMATEDGALKLPGSCAEVPVKSISADRLRLVHPHRDLDHRAAVELVAALAVAQRPDHPAHRLLGVVLHVPHVGVHHVQPEVLDQRPQFGDALLVGGDLRAQVGQVGRRVAGRVRGRAQQAASVSASRSSPPATSSQLSISTPSSSTRVLNAGIEPGVIPPISAWWPREAT